MRDTFDRDNAREREKELERESERGRYLVQRSHRVQWTFSWLFIHAASLRKIKDLSAGVWHKNENQKLKKKLKKIKDKKKKTVKANPMQTHCAFCIQKRVSHGPRLRVFLRRKWVKSANKKKTLSACCRSWQPAQDRAKTAASVPVAVSWLMTNLRRQWKWLIFVF